jgi:hypothetical protein
MEPASPDQLYCRFQVLDVSGGGGGGRGDDEDVDSDHGLDIEGLSQKGDSPTPTQHAPVNCSQIYAFTTNHPRQFGIEGNGRRESLARLELNSRKQTSILSKHT